MLFSQVFIDQADKLHNKGVFVIKYEFIKNGFKQGEYSIYKNKYNGDQITVSEYIFGVSKKREAINITSYLNLAMLFSQFSA